MAHILAGYISSGMEWRTILHPLTKDQRVIYNLLRSRFPDTIIAGGFASHNYQWKALHTDVDFFIPLHRSSDLVGLQDELIELIADISFEFRVRAPLWVTHSHSDMHRSSKTPVLRLSHGFYNVDIVATVIPDSPTKLLPAQKMEWNAFYITAGFDVMLSKVAILHLHGGEGLFVAFGTKEFGLREIELRINIAHATREEVEKAVAFKSGRLRAIDRTVYERLIDTIQHKIRRMEKYRIAFRATPHPEPRKLAAFAMMSLSYYAKPDAVYTLPSCVRLYEDRALKNEAVMQPLRDWINSTFSSAFRDQFRMWNLPKLPVGKKCAKCRFPRRFFIDY